MRVNRSCELPRSAAWIQSEGRDGTVIVETPRAHLARGFSLLELLMTIAITGFISGISYFAFANVLPTIRADSALQLLGAQIRQARQISVDQRRNVLLTFQGTGEIVTVKQNLDLSTTPLTDYFLPYGMVFMVFTGVPDTPDGWGGGSPPNPVNFNCGSALPLPCTIAFQGDGSVVDHTGAYVNGTVFIGTPGQTLTGRAVTILGATGRIRSYRYSGSAWF